MQPCGSKRVIILGPNHANQNQRRTLGTDCVSKRHPKRRHYCTPETALSFSFVVRFGAEAHQKVDWMMGIRFQDEKANKKSIQIFRCAIRSHTLTFPSEARRPALCHAARIRQLRHLHRSREKEIKGARNYPYF